MKACVAILFVLLAACAVPKKNPETLPRGFSQPGSPFPYNSTGW